MKDFIGQTLNIGDIVIFAAPSYRMMAFGTIASFSKSGLSCVIKYKNTWNYGKEGMDAEVRQGVDQVIKYVAPKETP